MKQIYVTLFTLFTLFGGHQITAQSAIKFGEKQVKGLNLTEAELYNKVLGNIVGSAIGDAMGAPTEMWSRDAIQLEYGFVKGLDSMVREVSPEGTWKTNLPAGGTTDDTRWKELAFEYLTKQKTTTLNANDFASEILAVYQKAIDRYKEIDSFEPEPYEENTLHVAWLQEWAKVAKPFNENNLDAYSVAMSKFYGGEMVCAGLLYAPAIGVFYPGDANRAYDEMYKLSFFDVGYARDISGLAAAMTAVSMKKDAKKEDLLDVLRSVDPQHYFKSRLVGRTSYRILQKSLGIVKEANDNSENSMQKAFELLDQNQQDMPFHAGEIHLQVLVAMLYSDFDFMKTMQFLTNYGRDNDTTAAIAGGILGTFCGFDGLPVSERQKVIDVSNTELSIDLEKLAQNLTKRIIKLQ
ncbi:ADP-ribosylglycohydrolase family protein [Arcticibacterium luteifluviistationis]|uniref:ADP-ribosylglycohydrolase family protein n=1 Tax=Arcticibacterium luteifluviistationis TaxID=1784714 RepID=A0A2Z4GEP3_9BACT|nr:ADP-ribosylglycohydrolase family protein [Arcticibacterium luteifluviistationis]AWV99736.1 ADP-ribosylglycohydrolase family protein [Arcticibacterium luteifluviistationis]